MISLVFISLKNRFCMWNKYVFVFIVLHILFSLFIRPNNVIVTTLYNHLPLILIAVKYIFWLNQRYILQRVLNIQVFSLAYACHFSFLGFSGRRMYVISKKFIDVIEILSVEVLLTIIDLNLLVHVWLLSNDILWSIRWRFGLWLLIIV